MGRRTGHAPGTFSWVDLATSDAAAAKAFYGDLLGWEFEDNEVPGGGVYTMCTLDGAFACAIMEQQQVPSRWNSYVTVADADAAVARARELGATVIEEAFDVMDSGRMARFSDPTGAALCVWQPRRHPGAGIVNAPGALTWNELRTTDIAAASGFYGELFGWSAIPMEAGDGPAYHVIRNGERSNGGITKAQPGEPPSWVPYFAVADLESALSQVADAGGELRAGPIPFPAGRIAILADPQQAPFALWEGVLED